MAFYLKTIVEPMDFVVGSTGQQSENQLAFQQAREPA